MHPLTISLPDYLYDKLSQQAQTVHTSLEEFVLFQLKRDETRDSALVFLQNHVGKCLIVQEPILEDSDPLVWKVPVFTNVAPTLEVGEIIIHAETGEILSTDKDVSEMIKKGHISFGFEPFAEDKQKRLAELLALNGEGQLESDAKQEMEYLLAEEQALQLQNLEALEKRLLS